MGRHTVGDYVHRPVELTRKRPAREAHSSAEERRARASPNARKNYVSQRLSPACPQDESAVICSDFGQRDHKNQA